MKFELLPVLDMMEELYSQPLTRDRFSNYLNQLLGGTKGDLKLPIVGFNPMAKEHVMAKIQQLKQIHAEQVAQDVLEELNKRNTASSSRKIKVALNVADDVMGGWTNRYTTEFDSQFKLNAFVTRSFCTPYLWTSEEYSVDLIKSRVVAYASRTAYWLKHGKLATLEDHVQQELYVQSVLDLFSLSNERQSLLELDAYFQENKLDDSYARIFNFFYGDDVCASLGYAEYGVKR